MGITKLTPNVPKPPGAFLWPWEGATLPESQLAPGWLPADKLPALTWLLTGLIMMALSATVGWPAAILSLPLARLMALDLTTHTLPDVYTLPLLAVGLAHAWSTGRMAEALLAVTLVAALLVLVSFFGRSGAGNKAGGAPTLQHRGIGGGDLKLMLALFAWLPPAEACFAVGMGCVLWLPFGFWRPRHVQPFGVALGLGWVAMLVAGSFLPGW